MLALFVLAENRYERGNNEEEPYEETVGSSVADPNDNWCARDYDCAEGHGCANSQCFVLGKPKPHLDDLSNCVEVEVHGFDEYMTDIEYCGKPGLVCNEKGRKIEHMDGVYMLLEKKSESGGRVFKTPTKKYYDDESLWQNSVPVYFYWDANRNKWYFDDDVRTNNIMASSGRLADHTQNKKRWYYWLGNWYSNVPVSVHCKNYYEPSGYTDSCVNDFVEKKNWREKRGNGVCKTYYDSNWANDCACDCKNNKHVSDCAAYSIGYDSGLDPTIAQRKYKWDKEFRYCCFVDRSKFDWSQTEQSFMEWKLYTIKGLAAKDTGVELTEEDQLAAENGRLREANKQLKKALNQMQA